MASVKFVVKGSDSIVNLVLKSFPTTASYEKPKTSVIITKEGEEIRKVVGVSQEVFKKQFANTIYVQKFEDVATGYIIVPLNEAKASYAIIDEVLSNCPGGSFTVYLQRKLVVTVPHSILPPAVDTHYLDAEIPKVQSSNKYAPDGNLQYVDYVRLTHLGEMAYAKIFTPGGPTKKEFANSLNGVSGDILSKLVEIVTMMDNPMLITNMLIDPNSFFNEDVEKYNNIIAHVVDKKNVVEMSLGDIMKSYPQLAGVI